MKQVRIIKKTYKSPNIAPHYAVQTNFIFGWIPWFWHDCRWYVSNFDGTYDIFDTNFTSLEEAQEYINDKFVFPKYEVIHKAKVK